MLDMCIIGDDVVLLVVNHDDDIMLYAHDLCCWIVIMLLWDDSPKGELLSSGQCIFCLLSGGDFKHYVVAALTCCDIHSLCHCC